MVHRNGKFTFSEISIGAWNIHNIWQRINSFRYNPDFLDFIKKKKVFGLIETHHTADETGDLRINGFKCFSLCRPKDKNKKRYKPSGGIAAYVHKSILPGVEKVPSSGSEALILKLRKEYFGIINDIFIVYAYCSPANSSIFSSDFMPADIYEDLGDKLSQCANKGSIILLGDMNARTQLLCDYIDNENNDYVPVPPPAMYDVDTVATEIRSNTDRGTNSYGAKFINLCKTVPLRILNGRKLGDLLGNFTCFTALGSSCVDYGAVSPELFNLVPYFSVAPPCLTLSDHTPIELGLKVKCDRVPVTSTNIELCTKPSKIEWDTNLTQKFKTIIESPNCKEALQGFLDTGVLPDQKSVDSAVGLVSNILLETAKLAGMQMRKGAVPRRAAKADQPFKRLQHPKWHDENCREKLKEIKITACSLKSDPKNSFLRGRIIVQNKEYKRLLKFKQKEFTDSLFSQLEGMHQSDPRKYMQLVNSLKSGSFDKVKPSDTEAISPDEWFRHFSNLLGKPPSNTESELRYNEYFQNNVDKLSSNLDQPFTKKDFIEAVRKLKNNKATCFDQVSNEMLKNGSEPLAKPLLLIFNTILKFNLYPNEWKKDILAPLHKSGDKTDVNNFRGLAYSSCLGKLFNSMLRQRLEKLCIDKCFVTPCQASGKAGAQTSDHLLVLKHIIHKYIKVGKQKLIYMLF